MASATQDAKLGIDLGIFPSARWAELTPFSKMQTKILSDNNNAKVVNE